MAFLGTPFFAERGSRFLQFARSPFCERVRAAKHTPRGTFRLIERRHGLVEIVERGAGVEVERSRMAHRKITCSPGSAILRSRMKGLDK